jgi:signal transduction histidine kinase
VRDAAGRQSVRVDQDAAEVVDVGERRTGDDEAARRALAAVETSSRSALKEMRQLLTVLRGPEDPEAGPLPGLADIADLVTALTDGGVRVTAHVTDEPVRPALQLTAYRIVQESLTNAVKHAPGAAVAVDVHVEQGSLLVQITSTGQASATGGGGTGRDGIRARVAAAGGSAQIGPTADGWCVRAELPLVAS